MATIQSIKIMKPVDKHLSQSFQQSLQTTINKMKNYLVIFKVHGLEAIQVWSSEAYNSPIVSTGQQLHAQLPLQPLADSLVARSPTPSSALNTWSSASSSIASANSIAPSSASTISESETDEDYFSGTDSSTVGRVSSRSKSTPRILYTITSTTSNNKDSGNDDFELITLEQPSREINSCKFRPQSKQGQAFKASDMVILRSKLIDASQIASYEVSFAFGLSSNKFGRATINLDPKRGTQGLSRAHIYNFAASDSDLPIGQLSFDFLIITNPIAFGVGSPQPSWLSRLAQLDAGHRGSGSGCRVDIPGSIVENTVDSFNYAARHGADMCELDVFVSADSVPVVYHDFDVDVGKAGKIQVSDYTLKQLREFSRLSLHNDEGRHLELDVTKQAETNRPFPTLEEVLKNVDASCALNIEIKWPQLMNNGKLQGNRNREVNDFVDCILQCINAYHNGRSIILSTFDADIAIMMRLKQTQFPVLFLTTGDSQRFLDPRTKTVKNGIHFAQAFELAGINPRSDHITQYLVRYAKDRNLLVYSWGSDINSAQAIRELKRIGLNGVIYDKIDLIKPKD